MKIEIKSWITGSILFEGDFSCLSDAVKAAVKAGADLTGANLARANLTGANLARANLARANLARADLSWANLARANLARANLARADLSWANLAGADLARADLARADLSWANLAWADLAWAAHAWAQVAFSGHGECGRMLTAVVPKEGNAPQFFCGCFTGDEDALRDYIAKGAPHLSRTRTLAVDTVLALLAARNDEIAQGGKETRL